MNNTPPPAKKPQPPWKAARPKKPRPRLNCIYCIKLHDTHNALQCYKVGASSTDNGRIWVRAKEIRTSSKIPTAMLRWAYTGYDAASAAEDELLALGIRTPHTGWPGHKEVRALTPEELAVVMRIMDKYETPFPSSTTEPT